METYIKTIDALSLFRRVYSHWLASAMYIYISRSRSREKKSQSEDVMHVLYLFSEMCSVSQTVDENHVTDFQRMKGYWLVFTWKACIAALAVCKVYRSRLSIGRTCVASNCSKFLISNVIGLPRKIILPVSKGSKDVSFVAFLFSLFFNSELKVMDCFSLCLLDLRI